MHPPPVCPRCSGPLDPPGLWSSAWRCEVHGEVPPQAVALAPSVRGLVHLAAHSGVPVWLPDPLPPGWLVTGFLHCGDERSGIVATAVAASGPHPLGGPAELLLVAEEPGVGLGARFAGLQASDPGDALQGPAEAKLLAAGHPTALWPCWDAPPDRSAFAGEAKGLWLWVVTHPSSASAVLLEDLILRDARDGGPDPELGALSPLLA